MTKHKQLSQDLKDRDIEGARRSYFLYVFCEQFLGLYKHNSRSGFLCCYDNPFLDKEVNYFSDILQFCLTTDVCDRLNMSFTDFMKLDLQSYRKIRDMLKATPKPETKELKDTLDKLQIK